jgi:hypothetical protein
MATFFDKFKSAAHLAKEDNKVDEDLAFLEYLYIEHYEPQGLNEADFMSMCLKVYPPRIAYLNHDDAISVIDWAVNDLAGKGLDVSPPDDMELPPGRCETIWEPRSRPKKKKKKRSSLADMPMIKPIQTMNLNEVLAMMPKGQLLEILSAISRQVDVAQHTLIKKELGPMMHFDDVSEMPTQLLADGLARVMRSYNVQVNLEE